MAFDAILLAAGYGTRLRPLTEVLPKCLVPIHGRPLIDYWLEPLFAAGAERVLVNTHYKADLVEKYLELTPWRAQIEIIYEDALLGTAGTLMANQAFVGGNPCLLAHADNLSIFPVGEFLNAHDQRPEAALLTMMTFTTTDPQSCGIVVTDDEGLVAEFHEKVEDPPGRLANGAVFVIDRSLIGAIELMPSPVVELSTDVLPHLIGRIFTWENRFYHRDIGSLASLAEAGQDFTPPVQDSSADERWEGFMATLPAADRAAIANLTVAAGAGE